MRFSPSDRARWNGYCLVTATLMCSVFSTTAFAASRRTPVVEAVDRATPSVVNIHGRKTVRNDDAPTAGDHFRQVNGMGTGIVIDERGYVLTNHHVVDGVSRIQVTLHNRQSVGAKLIAHDHKTDLAIIKLDMEDKKLPLMKIGTSADLMSGETVIAIGNAYGYEHTVTTGIISALHRTVQVSDDQTYQDVIQTSADINPGNSGGPLLNIDGEMIGINVAVRIGAQGIAFAIPIDNALEIAADLMNAERIGKVSHGVIGKTTHVDLKPQYVITSFRKDSVAEQNGLERGDVVLEVAGIPIERSLDFERAMLGRTSGESIEISVQRDGEPVSIKMAMSGPARKSGSTADRAWELLGLKFEAVNGNFVQQIDSRFNGGLRITDVRAGSVAATQRLRNGDILVGMQSWETTRPADVTFVLNRPEVSRGQAIKFYVLRGTETLSGHMRVNLETTR